MIIIPRLKTVVVMPPRTGSGTLKKAILATHEDAILLYRHMEADGVPQGYDRYYKVGVCRDPLDRLWSLYKFLRTFGLDGKHDQEYARPLRESVSYWNFSGWILDNQRVFTSPYGDTGSFWPLYSVRHHLPENRKSQWLTLRPDLGTEIFRFGDFAALKERLELPELGHENGTGGKKMPRLTPEAAAHMRKYFWWDAMQTKGEQS